MQTATGIRRLHLDVLGFILTFLPDRGSLFALVSSSKFFYDDVFDPRRDFFVLRALLNEEHAQFNFTLALARAASDLHEVYTRLEGKKSEQLEVCIGVRARLVDKNSAYWTKAALPGDVKGLLEVLRAAASVEVTYSLRYVHIITGLILRS